MATAGRPCALMKAFSPVDTSTNSVKETQTRFYALDLRNAGHDFSIDDGFIAGVQRGMPRTLCMPLVMQLIALVPNTE